MTFDQQIEQIEAMAKRHYPEDEVAMLAYMNEKLKERLRELTVRFQRLEVRHLPDPAQFVRDYMLPG